ncbi:MAG TPA: DCC1-like thiol-disulfide oxidoreductase family protein [Solirubrobacteraceae bacterium]|jgi:predicted DCC family thiol-disulfide oxidoreductase YuxK
MGEASSGATASGGARLFYDSACGVCVWIIALVARRAPRGAFVLAPLDGPVADAALAGLDREARYASWHVVDEAGRLHSGGAALAFVAARMPGGRAVAALLRATPRLTERGYVLAARRRGVWSRLVPSRAVARARAEVGVR